jgi:D-xylose 1-dehydrogenase (NADP+, D-xylono-1,5-lactone-forming)
MPCNWGILGPGFVATRAVIPALQQTPNARIIAVASRNDERAKLSAARFGIEHAYHDYQTLINDPDVDAVYIALPNHLHRIWTMRAAEAGKHILCEKPLAVNAAECDDKKGFSPPQAAGFQPWRLGVSGFSPCRWPLTSSSL